MDKPIRGEMWQGPFFAEKVVAAGNTIAEKLAYNDHRQDHTAEHRASAGGKRF